MATTGDNDNINVDESEDLIVVPEGFADSRVTEMLG